MDFKKVVVAGAVGIGLSIFPSIKTFDVDQTLEVKSVLHEVIQEDSEELGRVFYTVRLNENGGTTNLAPYNTSEKYSLEDPSDYEKGLSRLSPGDLIHERRTLRVSPIDYLAREVLGPFLHHNIFEYYSEQRVIDNR